MTKQQFSRLRGQPGGAVSLTQWANNFRPGQEPVPAEIGNVPTGAQLCQRRIERGLVLPEVASAAGLSVPEVDAIEAGEDTRSSRRQRVADAMNTFGPRAVVTEVARPAGPPAAGRD